MSYRAIASDAGQASGQPSRNDHQSLCSGFLGVVDAGLDRLCPLESTRLDGNQIGAGRRARIVVHPPMAPAGSVPRLTLISEGCPQAPRRRRAAVPG